MRLLSSAPPSLSSEEAPRPDPSGLSVTGSVRTRTALGTGSLCDPGQESAPLGLCLSSPLQTKGQGGWRGSGGYLPLGRGEGSRKWVKPRVIDCKGGACPHNSIMSDKHLLLQSTFGLLRGPAPAPSHCSLARPSLHLPLL